MPVDPEIRRLAANPDVIAAIKIVDLFFERTAEQRDSTEITAEEYIEHCWRMLKRGILCFSDDFDDDDDDVPIIQEAVTPGQRAEARIIGGKLYAARQYLRHSNDVS